MKNGIALVLMLVCFVSFAEETQTKIAVVDMQTLIAKYWKFPLAQKRIKTTQESLQSQLDKMNKEVQELVKKGRELGLELESPALKEQDKETQKKAFDDLKLKLQQKQQAMVQTERRFQAELEQTRNKEHQQILNEVSAIVDAYAKQQNLDLVLEKVSVTSNTRIVAYVKPELDITEPVLKLLNANTE